MPRKNRTNPAPTSVVSKRKVLPRVAVITATVIVAAALVPVVWNGLYQTSSEDGRTAQQEQESRREPDPPSRSPTETQELLERVNHVVYEGDYEAVQHLLNGKDLTSLFSELSTAQSPIHLALQGRHDSLSRDPTQLIGQHEEVVQYLLENAQLNSSQGCPVYFAVHYRNCRALEILLSSSDVNRCLTS